MKYNLSFISQSKIFKKYTVMIGAKFGERVCTSGDTLDHTGIVPISECGTHQLPCVENLHKMCHHIMKIIYIRQLMRSISECVDAVPTRSR